MKDKIWIKTELSTEYEQDIRIQPTDSWNGIEISFKEAGDEHYTHRLYVNELILEAMIAKMREMMEHVKH